jgi:DNA-directed RNA polymerase specialized sigma24 family protein
MSEPLPSPVRPIDFNELVDRHYTALFRFGLSLAKNANDAADLTPQTFFLWAEKGHQLRDLAKVKSWLFTTLYRESLSTYRHSTKIPHVELDDVSPEIPSVAPSIFNDIDGHTVVAGHLRAVTVPADLRARILAGGSVSRVLRIAAARDLSNPIPALAAIPAR